jgi:hypothetical protein
MVIVLLAGKSFQDIIETFLYCFIYLFRFIKQILGNHLFHFKNRWKNVVKHQKKCE